MLVFIGIDHISCYLQDKIPGLGLGGLLYVKAMWGKGTTWEDEPTKNTPSRKPTAGENRGTMGSVCLWAIIQDQVNAPGMNPFLFARCALTSLCLHLISHKEVSLVGAGQIHFKINFSLILTFWI